MKIVIAGGSGFLGKLLQTYWRTKGYMVYVLTRNPQKEGDVYWNATETGEWTTILEGADVLINLTGKSVDCRYTYLNKRAIFQSRIQSTVLLRETLAQLENPPRLWINASSATIYIHAERQEMDEATGIVGDDFSMNICKDWEQAFFEGALQGVRKVAIRTSIVLGNGGGAFPKMKQLARWYLGGHQGSGQQWMSWVHEQDFCRAIDFIIQQEGIYGVLNVTAPEPIQNNDFMQELRGCLRVSFGMNSPVFLLEIASLLMQTETELLLKSRRVVPRKLTALGFVFQFPTIAVALKHLC